MTEQIDLILGFTGGIATVARADAINTYCKQRYANIVDIPPIIVSGRCSGMNQQKPERAEADLMKDRLVSMGLNPSNIFPELESLDGIASIIYSVQIAQQNGIPSENIAFVTSPLAVRRVQDYLQLILGKGGESIPYESGASWFDKLVEDLVHEATLHDLHYFLDSGLVQTGDIDSFDERYLKTVHPFHGKDPRRLWKTKYGRGVIGLRIVQTVKAMGREYKTG